MKKKNGEAYRPKLHFTPVSGWMNDPVGLIYDGANDEYHICVQYQADVNCDSQVSWKATVSKDLLSFDERGIILSPDRFGVMFSGSSVIDRNNDSGLFDCGDGHSNIVTFYTNHNLESKHEYQALAYSQDGRNWTLYRDGKPVIANKDNIYGAGFRDPKVTEIHSGGRPRWLMTVGGGKAALFTSGNLLDWTFQSHIGNCPCEEDSILADMRTLQQYLPENDAEDGRFLFTECPDLFPLSDADGTKKWVLSCAGLFYIIGDLTERDGKIRFIPLTEKFRVFYCPDFFAHTGEPYASQSFYDEKHDRRVMFSWLMDTTAKKIAGKSWNGALSLPMTVTLYKNPNGNLRVKAYPIPQFDALRTETLPLSGRACALAPDGLYDIVAADFPTGTALSLSNGTGAEMTVSFDGENGVTIVLNGCGAGIKNSATRIAVSDLRELRIILDTSVIDLFINGGERVFTTFFFLETRFTLLTITRSVREPAVTVHRLAENSLRAGQKV